MASVRNLKKDINYVLGDIIEAVFITGITAKDKATEAADKIIDDAVTTFDELIAKVNQKGVEDKKKHFREVRCELETRARELVDRINAL